MFTFFGLRNNKNSIPQTQSTQHAQHNKSDKNNKINNSTKPSGFEYLDPAAYYFDSACQTLRPQPVIDTMTEYYHNYNTCGHRVSYPWGEQLDSLIEQTRRDILTFVGKTGSMADEYTVAFTLNTTYGLNLVLSQLNYSPYKRIITSEIEHNSVFLPTMVASKQTQIPRHVLKRDSDGSLLYTSSDLDKAVVVVNSTSNIDGRHLTNIKQLEHDIHTQGGLLVLDGCQTLGHNPALIHDIDFDVLCGSGHKMYGPSIGFIVIKKSLINSMQFNFIGGGTVQDVTRDDYTLINDMSESYSLLEPGLQLYAEIIGLGAALRWRNAFTMNITDTNQDNQTLTASEYESYISDILYTQLSDIKNISIINHRASSTISLIPQTISAHQLGLYLGQAGFMVRTGYHCCHYYLKDMLKLPPTLRISLGLHTTVDEITKLTQRINTILN